MATGKQPAGDTSVTDFIASIDDKQSQEDAAALWR
jgi:hypothetical protein